VKLGLKMKATQLAVRRGILNVLEVFDLAIIPGTCLADQIPTNAQIRVPVSKYRSPNTKY